MCEQAIQEEREEELLDVDTEITADVRQEQSRNVSKNILPNEAFLGRAKMKYQFNPNAQAEISAVNSKFPIDSNLNPSAAAYKTTVLNDLPVVEHPEQGPQPSWDPTKSSQTSFPNHSQIAANHPHVSTVGSSSVNVPPTMQMYTLQESFGKPHIIAGAHIKTLIDLPNIQKADGSTLLEFSRHLDSTNRTLKGMGTQYVSDLNHLNTLKDLSRKLLVFLRVKWAEEAGKIYQNGSKPQFADFLQFIKKRAALMNNEFGDDHGVVDKEKLKKDKERNGRLRRENSAFVAGVRGKDNGKADGNPVTRSCQMCSGQHGIWQCEQFKQLSVCRR